MDYKRALVNIGPVYGLVPSGDKLLPEQLKWTPQNAQIQMLLF